ncbi:MAG: 1,3-beta-galactosyl-N-acetylhexosamine phosphorylase, partial [Clostridia bacterium]|nr:1,3-beta-galactosyl-N-acetylhexosamine phosphorylase [Clostridia bacterium]
TKGDRCFALADVLGVDKEKGFTLSEDKYNIQKKPHFITAEIDGEIDCGEGMKNVYALKGADVLDIQISPRFTRNVNVGEVKLAANDYVYGRGVYLAGLPYSPQNARLLLRALYWSAHKEKELEKAYSSNVNTDCTYYPETKKYAIINNANEEVKTTFFDVNGKAKELTLGAGEIVWIQE